MEILEKQLEDMICLPNAKVLQQRGLDIFDHDHLFRQFNLGSYGIVDLVGITLSDDGGPLTADVVIYELKKDEIGMSALGQACRYKKAFEDYLYDKLVAYDVRIVLIGSKIEESSNFVYAASCVSDMNCYTYSMGITGLHFNEINLEAFYPGSFHERGNGALGKLDFHSLTKETNVEPEF